MTSEEAAGETKQPTKPARKPMSLEMKIATVGLGVGGILLLAAAAFFAMLLQAKIGPIARVAYGYIIAVAIGVAGHFARRRHEVTGRSAIAIAISLAYFTSFASHWLEGMRIFESAIIPIVLMVALAATIVFLAERWRSELIAAMGFGLGAFAALVSARSSDAFSLVALGVLALAAGILLVRNEWRRLTAMVLAATYLSSLLLWFILPIGQEPSEIYTHLGALVFYHVVFSAAFWKWGRAWVARERALEDAPEQFGTPSLQAGALPYSTAFALLNSLLFIALSVFLFWHTKTEWTGVEWLLGALALAEAARVAIPVLRRGAVTSFHALAAFGLACAAGVAAFSGLSEAAVMGFMALAVAVAASRAPVLKILRPLGAVCAFLAGAQIDNITSGPIATPVDLAARMMPGLLLLASALPWEAIWVIRPRRFATGVLGWVEAVSGQVRGFAGTLLVIAPLVDHFSTNTGIGLTLGLGAVAVTAGMVLLRAHSWFAGAFILTFFATAILAELAVFSDRRFGIVAWAAILLPACAFFWNELSARAMTLPRRIAFLLPVGGLPLAFLLAMGETIEDCDPMRGTVMFALGGLVLGATILQMRFTRLPAVIRDFEAPDEDAPPSPARRLDKAWRFALPGLTAGLTLLAAGCAAAATVDATDSILSAAIVSGSLLVAWFLLDRAKGIPSWFAATACALSCTVMCMAFILSPPLETQAGMEVFLLASAFAAMGWTMKRSAPLLTALGWFVMAPIVILADAGVPPRPDEMDTLIGLGTAAALILATPLLRHWTQTLTSGWAISTELARLVRIVAAMVVVATTIAAMRVATRGVLLPATFATASWGFIAAFLLALGLLFRDSEMRFTSMGVFVVAIGRFLVVDMTGAPLLTRAVASFFVGLLLIAAGIAYAFLRKRIEPSSLLGSSPAPPRADSDESASPEAVGNPEAPPGDPKE